MKVFNRKVLAAAIIGTGLVSSATAGEVFVTADISTSTTWTAGNTYNLQNQIYVLPGATLTIDGHPVMEQWEQPYMAELARTVS